MKIHMIGIGGIGMSALAQLYLTKGFVVTGSDRDHSKTTDLLEEKGVAIFYPQKAENVSEGTERAIYSDAIGEDNPERVRARELNIPEISYFDALGEISKAMPTVAVAGTHGKTTTTAMLTKILIGARKSPTAIIGSIVKDFGSNFVEGGTELFVVEACEYRDHLLKLSPYILIITNMEWDHTDWFRTEADMFETFKKAMQKVPMSGTIIVHRTSLFEVKELLNGVTAKIVEYEGEEVPELRLVGEFNRMNARAAKKAAKILDPTLRDESIDASLKDFEGTWRRFEFKGRTAAGTDIYDDYAHHPTAVEATIQAARERFPGKKIVVAFQPHLYSRTRDLFHGFAHALALADRVVLAPIYAAREEPIPGVSSDMLKKEIEKKNRQVILATSLANVETLLRKEDTVGDIIITMGAGDIYKVAEQLTV
jgi:UDP-N-acetylmuramate--alanine ligase